MVRQEVRHREVWEGGGKREELAVGGVGRQQTAGLPSAGLLKEDKLEQF